IYFFFQAEDGIRDPLVTGVQTCALPISPPFHPYPLDTGRSVLCGPVRRLAAPRRYLAVCPLELGLSSTRPYHRRAATITLHRNPRPEASSAPAGPASDDYLPRRRIRRARLSGESGPSAVRGRPGVPPAAGIQTPLCAANTSPPRRDHAAAGSRSGTSSSACTAGAPCALRRASGSRTADAAVSSTTADPGSASPVVRPSAHQSLGKRVVRSRSEEH